MPNNNNAQMNTARIGNLTCSAPIDLIIKHLKRIHCGALSQTRRAIIKDYFFKLSTTLKPRLKRNLNHGDLVLPISINDDIMGWCARKLCKSDLFTFQHFPEYGVCTKLSWLQISWKSKMLPCNFFMMPKTQTFLSWLQWALGWKSFWPPARRQWLSILPKGVQQPRSHHVQLLWCKVYCWVSQLSSKNWDSNSQHPQKK